MHFLLVRGSHLKRKPSNGTTTSALSRVVVGLKKVERTHAVPNYGVAELPPYG